MKTLIIILIIVFIQGCATTTKNEPRNCANQKNYMTQSGGTGAWFTIKD